MGEKILTPIQEEVLKKVASEPKLAGFYLSGGTALASHYLRHRLSDDLDFFTFEDIDSIFLHEFTNKLKEQMDASSLRFERRYDRFQFFFDFLKNGDLKVEFTKYPFQLLEQPQIIGGLKVDSFRDIAANKLMAMLERFDPKDFVDLFFIFRRLDLKTIRQDVESKFGIKIDHIFLGGELAKAHRIEALPKMLVPVTTKEIKDFFEKIAKDLKPEVLEI